MPVVTVKGKKKHLKYPANWSKMSPKQKAAYVRSKEMKMRKKQKKA
jgi:hypothetical protein|tara:strand:+ start:317 stop:454 length:138 start_codon:yes stop_codon:yes gene_type:complete